MTNSPKLSIIVPVYKVEAYLPRCLDSILAQTFTDFELILIDDGSPDRCGEIMEEYAKRDSRIVTIHQQNQGVSAARNAGLRIAQGQYIMFCDSDDMVAKTWAEYMLAAARQGHWSLILCNYSTNLADLGQYESGKEKEEVYYSDRFLEFLLCKPVGSVWNTIFKATLIRENNISFDSNYSYGEDKLFILEYLLCDDGEFCTRCQNVVLYYYSDQSIEGRLTKQFSEDRTAFLIPERALMLQIGRKFGVPAEEIQRYLKLKQDIAIIERIRGITMSGSFFAVRRQLLEYLSSADFCDAIQNPDIKRKLTNRFYKVLNMKNPLIVYLYDYLGQLRVRR